MIYIQNWSNKQPLSLFVTLISTLIAYIKRFRLAKSQTTQLKRPFRSL